MTEAMQYLVVCRECGVEFWSKLKPKGNKWTELCSDCLRMHL